MTVKYTFSVCCRKFTYPDFLVRTLVPARPKPDGLCWKILNAILVLMSLCLTAFGIYELMTGVAAPTADVDRLNMLSSSFELLLCGVPGGANGTGVPRFCFDPAALPAPPVCPELFEVTDTTSLVVDPSATSFAPLAIMNRSIGMISLSIVLLSYYTLLWRTRTGIKFATCGLSDACCKCCCTQEKCGRTCQSCSTNIDGMACSIDIISIPLVIVTMLGSAILLVWANNTHYHVQHKLLFRSEAVDLSACARTARTDMTEVGVALFTANATGGALVRTTFFERHAHESTVFASEYFDNFMQNIWPGALILVLTLLLLLGDFVNKLWEQSLEQDIVEKRVVSTMFIYLAPQPMQMTQMAGVQPIPPPVVVVQQQSPHQQHHHQQQQHPMVLMHANSLPTSGFAGAPMHVVVVPQHQQQQSMNAAAFTGMHTPNTSLRVSNPNM
jgi:hypothetical protein